MVFEDRTLVCVECGDSFTFSVDDQQYHQEKGYTNEPKRCPNCRQARRAERRYGDNFGGGGFGGNFGPRQMYPVTCAQCGNDAEVPSGLAATGPSTATTATGSSATSSAGPTASPPPRTGINRSLHAAP